MDKQDLSDQSQSYVFKVYMCFTLFHINYSITGDVPVESFQSSRLCIHSRAPR